jgi:glycosyltransferase involved in cell wall biosynthesis
MRVALLSGNAPRHNAVGNQIAEKVRFFQERGAEVRLFVQDAQGLHPDLCSCCSELREPIAEGPAWDFLRQADLVFAVYAQYHDLLQYLPLLAGTGPRVVFDYHGVTPSDLWHTPEREGLEQSARQRGYVWCADHALAASETSSNELLRATHFPPNHLTTLPLVVDTEHFRPEPGERWLQQRLGIDGPILLYVGRLAGNKRVPLLIEALARFDDSSASAVIVGAIHDVYAEEALRCQALAQQLGVSNRVHFLGQLDDAELARAYRSASVLVMPSLHEGFCVPVIEAMACGLPVIASRSAALPETVGDAGLTFVPNDVDDLVRQLRRVLDGAPVRPREERPTPFTTTPAPQPRGEGGNARRVAVVSFRFGADIVGGAETSLHGIARALRNAGHHVEVFTTCAKAESQWKNDLPAGTVTLDGLTVHRFPIDPHDPTQHGEIVREILDADGNVPPEMERRYLEHSIHSSALLASLGERQRRDSFGAIVTGPYLFGLTADIATEFPGQTLLVPCFHDEALARLAIWPRLYGNVGGILYHSAEEQKLAQQRLGVNHPNAREIGTCIAIGASALPWNFQRPYVVYCGRYSEQKNVPLLVEWARRYCAEQPGRLDFVFMGRGEVKLPSEPWLRDLGRVEEATKRSVLAGAKALVQLSTQESLSLVALEAWAQGTPVIAHRDCAVLAGQIERAQGGATAVDHATFANVLDHLWANETAWRERGQNGRGYVDKHYASATTYVDRLTHAIDQRGKPLGQQMRERGIERAAQFARERWQPRFAEFVEQLLTQPARARREALAIEPLRPACHAGAGARALLVPVRLVNAGTHAAVPVGPACTVICGEVREKTTDRVVVARQEMCLPALLMPGQTQVAALPIALPIGIGSYRLVLWTERLGAEQRSSAHEAVISLTIELERAGKSASCVSAFLDTVQETLPKAHRLQQLPADYVDVTEGRFAPVKRLVKRKLLNNFKHAYVDVLSRQQSQVNGQVVLMIQQLAECCAMLDHAVAGVHQRLDRLEARVSSFEVQVARGDNLGDRQIKQISPGQRPGTRAHPGRSP